MRHRFRLPCRAAAATSCACAALIAAPAAARAADNYIVLYQRSATPANVASTVTQSGGTLVADYAQIGVVVARSPDAAFATRMRQSAGVEQVAATTAFASKPFVDDPASAGDTGSLPNAPAADADTFSPLQWDMRQIKTPEAHAVTGGSPAVRVGDIDTGIDFTHPDLKPNIDVADSANCISGAPVPGTAAQDDNGHGTHTAGTIAAASNGIGIVGVAPNVQIAGIKAGNAGGFFFPEAVVCAFMWAGSHHMDVTNNSYFADPFEYNCRNDPVQHAIWKAEQRAIRFAQDQGTTVVAAAGNDSDDLSHPTRDVTSPDNTTPQQRAITNACVVIPVEIPGVVGVSADGHNPQSNGGFLKSFYSNFGVSAIDVVAPGGDSVFGRNAEAPNGRVLSTWPPNIPCARSEREPTTDPDEPTAVYCYQQGTSMASPHVAGVAALVVSRFGNLNNPQNGTMRPGAVEAYLSQTADPQPCPDTLPPGYAERVGVNSGQPQSCQGGLGHNSWYGTGQVDALAAVLHRP